jgi:hypothetical protein
MKKAILLLSFIIMSMVALCQSKAYCNYVELGRWNSYSKSWVYYIKKNVDLEFTLYKTGITINDVSHTNLTIKRYLGEESLVNDDGNNCNVYEWNCYDEKNRTCNFSMVNIPSTGVNVYIIMYNDSIFRYYVTDSPIDNFNRL